jgi:DNA-binding XRE family transcriptional regulator
MKNINSNTIPNSEWLHRMANAEDRCASVAVGGMAHDLGRLHIATIEAPKVFGRLIEFARRQRGLSVDALAQAAYVDLAEIVAIETEKNVVPTPRTVYQLAQVLCLPAPTLTELAGLA